jgi:hypothetical protein
MQKRDCAGECSAGYCFSSCAPGERCVGLRTVGEVVHATYREVAEARGLLSVEREFAEGLGQIAKGLGRALATVGDLRHTFVMMAVAGGEGMPWRGARACLCCTCTASSGT